ncbi:endonuclease MutS2 [Oscillospiraceae bacterium OttesenSCG-928-G22]|nr:endonuclease MutS2 [Oscillospiraceae bacterium OttesenSCG-928-G22]
MTSLLEKSIHTLELPRILERLASYAISDEAKERLLALRPTDSEEEAERLVRETSAARKLLGLRGAPAFSGVKDIAPSLRRVDLGGVLNMRELLQIGALLHTTRRVKGFYDEEGNIETCIDHLFSELEPDRPLEERILTSILNEDEMADSASPELSDIRRHIARANSKIRDTLQSIITSRTYSTYLQDPIITQRGGRFVVPVKSEHKGAMKGLVHDVSSSGQTFFIEPMQVVELNNEIRELEVKEKKEIERILAEFSVVVSESITPLLRNYGILIELDCIFAKGRFADTLRASEPVINRTFEIELKRARHPLLDAATAVPITVRLGRGFDTLVVTGPNTGGKTVTLKTLGLFSLMAACGLHIPADDGSTLPVFRGVFADIGDEQSIEQSLSTFSSHMTNIVAILGEAGPSSLVLFDELGAGTDPVEGAALAVSVIEYVRKLGARVAATTHYAELKEYALLTPGVENASCEFDVDTLKPTYRLLIGIPGKSNAFAISGRLGLPEQIIENAENLIDSENRRFEDVLAALDAERRAMEEEREESARLRDEARTDARKAKLYREELELERQKAREKAESEASRIVENAREEVETILAEVRDLQKRAQSESVTEELNRARSEMRGRLNAADAALSKKEKRKAEPPSRPLQAGDTVRLVKTGTLASVIKPPDAGGAMQLQAGILKVTARLDEVELVEEPKKKDNASGHRRVKAEVSAPSGRTELDLRGLMSDEAIMEAERFIDHALRSGVHTLTLIHGKGTGALRAAIQAWLKKQPQVRSFRLGTFGEGEAGVTVVELK